MDDRERDVERARTASAEEMPALAHHAQEEVLLALLENPNLEEPRLILLLERKDLTGVFLEELARHKSFLRSYRIRRALAFHPHTPRLVGMRLLRDLYLLDLAQLSLHPPVPVELKRQAEVMLIARLPQLPLGQKIMLARRGPGRVAGALLTEGHPQVFPITLDNAYLNEGQVLKVLSREKLPAGVVAAIARHGKWSHLYNVRVALARHPATPLAAVLSFLPHLTVRDLQELAASATLPARLRRYILHEVAQRTGPSPTQ